jgi:ABC-type Fe3+/spermidine/putrescine transport system ATPase subunit
MQVFRSGRIVQSGPPKAIADRPANVDVARLLGVFNLFPVEILELDPQRNLSRVRFDDFELTGPYFPGKLRGDRVWLCVRPEQLSLSAPDGGLGPNRVPVQLLRAIEMPQAVRLEFTREIVVELSAAEYEKQKHNKEWLVTFPRQALKVL